MYERAAARPTFLVRLKAGLSIGLRGLRGDARRLWSLFACILLGVAALVAIESVAASFRSGLNAEGRTLLGGDAAFSLAHRQLTPAERAWFNARGAVDEIAEMGAMARTKSGRSTFIALKAVGETWPTFGAALLSVQEPVQTALRPIDGISGAVADEALGARLNLHLGDEFSIGDETFRLVAWLESEPDGVADRFSLGPRMIIASSALKDTGLLGPGALVRWIYRVSLPKIDGRPPTRQAAHSLVRSADAAFPTAGWVARTRDEAAPQFRAAVTQLSEFLTLIALTALIIGGLGAASAARDFVDRHLSDFAVLKAIGVSGKYAAVLCLTQLMIVALLATTAGAALGSVIPIFLSPWIVAMTAGPYVPGLSFSAIGSGMGFGMLIAFAFAIVPVGRAHEAPVAALFRWTVSDARQPVRPVYRLFVALAATGLIALALFTAEDRKTAAIYLACAFGTVAALSLLSAAVVAIARRTPRFGSAGFALALGNLHRPGAPTKTVIISLGLSLSLTAALGLAGGAIRSEIGAPTSMRPSLFMLDIPAQDGGRAFFRFIEQRFPNARIRQSPMVRGRITRINDVAAAAARVASSSRWVLSGDRGLTYAASPPPGDRIVAGKWWSKDYAGPPLVSLDDAIARDLGLHVGNSISVNVLGHEIKARIANLRHVDWRSLGLNFVLVYSPNALAGAPHTILATVGFPANSVRDADLHLIRDLGAAFPTVAAIRLKDLLNQMNALFDQLGSALSGMLLFVYVLTVIVVSAAVAGQQGTQTHQAVVLKVFGATRNFLLRVVLIQYSLIGLASAAASILLGSLTALIFSKIVLRLPLVAWTWRTVVLYCIASVAASVITGVIFTAASIARRPAEFLREA